MKKLLILITLMLLIGIWITTWLYATPSEKSTLEKRGTGLKLFLHDHGKTTEIRTDQPGSTGLVNTVEEVLTTGGPGRMLHLAVFPETIEEIKQKGVSVEVIYPRVEQFTVGRSVINANRLLIALYTGPVTTLSKDKAVTVFYGKFSMFSGGYSSGPYRNSGDFDTKIRTLLLNMRYQL